MILLKGHASGTAVWSIAFAPDSQRLVSAGNDHTLRLWDLRTGRGRLLQRADLPRGVAFSPCGGYLAYGCGPQTLRLRLSDNTTADLGGEALYPCTHAFSPCGDLLLSGGYYLQPFDAHLWKPLPRWEGGPQRAYPVALAFRPDGRALATAHVSPGSKVRLWEVGTWKLLGELHNSRQLVNSLAFSACGRCLAGTGGPSLLVWDAATGAVLHSRTVDGRHFQSCVFSPDGRLLAAAHNDGRARLYEAAGWAEVAAYDWGVGPLVAVAFAPDGMKAAASSKRGLIVVWDVDV